MYNVASGLGGGVFLPTATFTAGSLLAVVEDCFFLGNSASEGGHVYAVDVTIQAFQDRPNVFAMDSPRYLIFLENELTTPSVEGFDIQCPVGAAVEVGRCRWRELERF